jgi:hypothetical protein
MKLYPYHQGRLDGLCCIYSVINATRLALRPGRQLGSEACSELFAVLAAELDRDGQLLEVLTQGANYPTLSRLLWRADQWLREVCEWQLCYRRPHHKGRKARSHSVVARLARHLTAPHTSAIVALTGDYSHWTVVRAVTPSSLVLFDSDDMRRIARGAQSRQASVPTRPHARDLYLLWCEPLE